MTRCLDNSVREKGPEVAARDDHTSTAPSAIEARGSSLNPPASLSAPFSNPRPQQSFASIDTEIRRPRESPHSLRPASTAPSTPMRRTSDSPLYPAPTNSTIPMIQPTADAPLRSSGSWISSMFRGSSAKELGIADEELTPSEKQRQVKARKTAESKKNVGRYESRKRAPFYRTWWRRFKKFCHISQPAAHFEEKAKGPRKERMRRESKTRKKTKIDKSK